MMTPTLTQLLEAVSGRFIGVIQSVVATDAEATALEGAGPTGWLVPCELSGSIVGTWYLSFATAEAETLAARVLMQERATAEETAEAVKELVTQSVAGVNLAPPFVDLTIVVGNPVAVPMAPGAPLGGFACRLDEATVVRVGCSYSAGAASSVRGAAVDVDAPPAAPRGRAASASTSATPDNLDLILDIDMPLTVRFGEAVMTLESLARLGPGSLVELSREPDDPVDVLLNGRLVARGEVVVVAGNYGVRITEVASAAERLRTLNA
jgi:flagellar motor switch protein FliN